MRIVKREAFRPGPLGILINPFYIIRKGLYDAICRVAPTITGRVLDFGCGAKPYESAFVNADEYIGVDLAVSGHKHYDSKVDVYYDGRTLPFDDAAFDAVVAFEVFEHLFNLEEMLREIRRVIRPGGKLFFTVPFVWDEHEIPYDFGRYTSFGIRAVLERNGFAGVRVDKTTNYYQAVSQLRIAYVFQHVLPANPVLKRVLAMLVVAPMTAMTVALNMIMPKSHNCFCHMAILCERSEDVPVSPGA
jgi:SAM-dependent methyltransferase